MRLGKLPQRPVLIPITPLWQKLWKNGRLSCSPVCCPVFIRLWRRLTGGSRTRFVRCIPTISRRLQRCRSSMTDKFGWLIWRLLEVSRSTVWQSCTLRFWSIRSWRISMRWCRRNLTTRPTALLRDVSCFTAIPFWLIGWLPRSETSGLQTFLLSAS